MCLIMTNIYSEEKFRMDNKQIFWRIKSTAIFKPWNRHGGFHGIVMYAKVLIMVIINSLLLIQIHDITSIRSGMIVEEMHHRNIKYIFGPFMFLFLPVLSFLTYVMTESGWANAIWILFTRACIPGRNGRDQRLLGPVWISQAGQIGVNAPVTFIESIGKHLQNF